MFINTSVYLSTFSSKIWLQYIQFFYEEIREKNNRSVMYAYVISRIFWLVE